MKKLTLKKKIKVDWKNLWKDFDKWYSAGENRYVYYSWQKHKKKIEELVEQELQTKKVIVKRIK